MRVGSAKGGCQVTNEILVPFCLQYCRGCEGERGAEGRAHPLRGSLSSSNGLEHTLLHKVKERREGSARWEETKEDGESWEDSIHVAQNAGPLKELSLSRGLGRCLHGDPLDWTDSYTRGPATSLNCEFRRVPHRQSSASQTSLFPRRRMTDLWY